MSVYYYLVCRKCKVRYTFVGVWAGGARFMKGSNNIPAEWHHHMDHIDQLRVCHEQDEEGENIPCKFEDDFSEEKE